MVEKRLSDEKQVSQIGIMILDLPRVRKRKYIQIENGCLSSSSDPDGIFLYKEDVLKVEKGTITTTA